ncbi:stage III sporulation protein AF [Ferdinandcohnia quinoae]|uniref:Stage III sporulation protein AF n=1 Tax=Fredinandcohnia quinoae TaxID=2918902 RepID=A0AAW5EB11_9BACI|nr:stage III sporulation protein AF [Fredinandcohnia sp. SECRCQ15]MCH1626621.1 stage III sporulation protein AF [Fredinandcohnia sp. SECRCQ15]
MDFIGEWITNIILFILLAVIVDMLLPNSSMQKYVKMVTGLLLIVIILTPLFSFLNSDIEQTLTKLKLSPNPTDKNIENLIEMKKEEIQAHTLAYSLETVAVLMKKQVEEELVQKDLNLVVKDVTPSMTDDSGEIMSIKVVLSEETVEPDGIPVVNQVDIDTSEQIEPIENGRDMTSLTNSLATIWEIDSEKIVVIVEGGKES